MILSDEELREEIRKLIDNCYNARNPDYPKLIAFQPMKFLNEIIPYFKAQIEACKEKMVEITPREATQILLHLTFATGGFFTNEENDLIAKLTPIAGRDEENKDK